MTTKKSTLVDVKITNNLSSTTIKTLVEKSFFKKLQAGETLIKSGQQVKHLSIIVKGKVKVIGHYDDIPDSVSIAHLGPGSLLGELSFIENKLPSESVVTTQECEILMIPNTYLTVAYLGQELYMLRDNLGKIAASRLRQTTSRAEQELMEKLKQTRTQLYFGEVLVKILLVFCLYVVSMPIVDILDDKIHAMFGSVLFLCIFTVTVYWCLRGAPYSLPEYGIVLHHKIKDVIEVTCLSIFILFISLVVKGGLLFMHGSELSWHTLFSGLYHPMTSFIPVTVYSIFTFFQEFSIRSGIQSTFQLLLVGSWSNRFWPAIIVSNGIFISTHMHKSFAFAMIVFLPGLFWGWLFSKYRSVFLNFLSHAIIGGGALFVIGFSSFIGV